MTIHGGGVPLYPVAPAAPDRRPEPVDAGSYRHFIRPPQESERFRVLGRPAEEIPDQARDLLGRLGNCLVLPPTHWTIGIRDDLLPWENPCIPAGYTYLAQLVAHDIVQTSLVFPTLRRDRGTLRNSRSFKLDLDTLYGSGPASCPYAYAIPVGDGYRAELRLSRMKQSSPEAPGASPPFRDIGRGRACLANDEPRGGPTEPLLVDPRNDDNAILSQITTIFIHLHNTVLAGLQREQPNPGQYPESVWLERQFVVARRIVTDIYRTIVRYDLLSKIIDPRIYAWYTTASPQMLDASDDDRVSLEFSHAAFRFGHAMVRPEYKINDLHEPFGIESVLSHTCRRLPQRLPLNEHWIIQWSRFFDLGDSSIINFSRRIGPDFGHGLELPANGYAFPLDGTPRTLAHRDLLRNATMSLWSVPALVEEIGRRQPTLIADSRSLSNLEATRGGLEQWMRAQRGPGVTHLSDDEIEWLAKDPPLLFFILHEAAEEAEGKHLGTLGSIIVAETLLKQLAPAPDPVPGDPTEQILGTQDIETMPTLLTVLAERSGLQDAYPPFL